jgi:hypothetical protein
VHAALDLAATHPHLIDRWRRTSNTIVLLAAADELALTWLYADAVTAGHGAVAVHEPDLHGSLTAVALEPAAHRLVAHLPLALSPGRALDRSTDEGR